MAEIKLKTDQSDQAIVILREAMKTEELRIKYALNVAQKKLAEFEKKYGVSSETFINEWVAEDLERVTIYPMCAHKFQAITPAQVIEYYATSYDPDDDIGFDSFHGEQSC